MPTYTYRCNDCGHVFEARQRMTDDPLTECPKCSGHIRRVVNSVGVVFKGKGFYVTDNRGNKAQPPSRTESSENGAKPNTEKKATDSAKSKANKEVSSQTS